MPTRYKILSARELKTDLTDNSDSYIASQKAVKTAVDAKMANPMTTAGDIIYGGASGTPTRLAKGTDGQVLTLASGNPSWATASGGASNFAVDPTLTNYFNFSSEWLTPSGTPINYTTNTNPATYNCYGGYSIIKWSGSLKYANKKFADIHSETNGNLYFTSVLRIIAKINVKIYNGSTTTGQAFIGFSSDSDGYFETENVSNYPRAGFVFDYQNEKIFAVNANGTGYTKTELTVSSPRNKRYSYIVDFDKANNTIKFYLNGSLVATHTTNIPNPSSTPIGFGFGTNNSYLEFNVSPMIASVKQS